MSNSNLPAKILQDQTLTEDASILIIGYNESLLNSLPDGYTTIDPSISKIKLAPSKHTNGSFQTQDLGTFSLNKSFTKVLSLNTLHLCKDLDKIFLQIQKHLEDEAILYFPLSPSPLITNFLETEKWAEAVKTSQFQTRTRSDVEDAVLAAPFQSVMIEEREEHQSFYSEAALQEHLQKQLSTLTNLSDEPLYECAKELKENLYKDQSTDEVLTLTTPWILLTLSNEKD